MAYVVLDFETANVIGAYKTEREALDVVLDTVQRYGADSRAALTLSLSGDAGFIAHGRALVQRALGHSHRKIA